MSSSIMFINVFMLLMLASINAGFQMYSGVTSCNEYKTVLKYWNQFDRICHIRRYKPKDPQMTCGYIQINYADQKLRNGVLPNGVTFLTYYDQSTNTSTTRNFTWTQGMKKGIVTQYDSQTSKFSISIAVVESDIGYCFVSCPILDVDAVASSQCSLPDHLLCCTFDQFAPESDVDQLISAAGAEGVNTYGAVATDQSSCPKTVKTFFKPATV